MAGADGEGMSAEPHKESRPSRELFWVVSGLVMLYLILDVIAQSLPPHYNPINTAESDLAVGPYGYVMALNFLNRGVLSLLFLYAFSQALRLRGADVQRYRTGILLLSVWGVGALLLAAFPTDVPATPVSWHGLIHLVVAFFAFVGGALGVLSLSLQFERDPALRGARKFALPIAVVAVLFFVLLFGLPFSAPHFASRVGGVTERVLIGSVLLWILYVSVFLSRGQRPARAASPVG